MRYIDKIVIHCSDSSFGNAVLIDKWHKENGCNGIGYHYVITNGYVTPDHFDHLSDGIIETGRSIYWEGAHVKGHNKNSIGICLIGKSGQFTDYQYSALTRLIGKLRESYPDSKIMFHSDLDRNKPHCPGIDPIVLLEIMSDG